MGFLLVMKAELVRNFIIMRRYWFRTLTGMALSYAMLLLLVLGFMYKGADVGDMATKLSSAESATNGIVGFIIGMFAFAVVGMFTQGLQAMAQNGQLEQLCMSPHGLITNFLARSIVGSVSMIVTSAILVWLLAASVGGTLYADFVPTVALLALSFANLIGFGFMVGGLVLIFKQTGQLAIMVRLALFGLAIMASDEIETWHPAGRWLAHALPITDAAICLKYVLIKGQMRPVEVLSGGSGETAMEFVSVFAHPSFFFMIANAIVWTLIGVTCFRVMENWSRHKGTLGAY